MQIISSVSNTQAETTKIVHVPPRFQSRTSPYRQVQMIEILEWTWFDGETIRFSEAFPEKWNLKDISESILKSKCHNYIDENNFIGWPILHNFDGFCIRDRFRGKEKKLIITDEDGHPNEEGQKFIAELIYDNL